MFMAAALEKTVYVGGLPPSTQPDVLRAVFAPHKILHATVVRTFGFVTFDTAEDACTCAERVDISIDGKPIHAALSHRRYRPGGADSNSSRGSGRGHPKRSSASVFVRIPGSRKQLPCNAVQQQLATACAPHTTSARVHVPRKGGGGNYHRGYAFVECECAADAATLLAGLAQGDEWKAELVRKSRRSSSNAKKAQKSRGKRGGKKSGH